MRIKLQKGHPTFSERSAWDCMRSRLSGGANLKVFKYKVFHYGSIRIRPALFRKSEGLWLGLECTIAVSSRVTRGETITL